MSVLPIDPKMLRRIMEPANDIGERCFGLRHTTDPAASLRASATAFEALDRPFDADLCLGLADGAAVDPELYVFWAREQAERVARLQENKK